MRKELIFSILKKRIKNEDPWSKDVPVIILTNLSDAANASEALRHHAFDFLVKSDWKLADVIRKVRERLGES